ncbi:LptF/LptG family permease [Nitrosophilus kaiyonis]|uniref:LptF/LptG family permease n=1 Tax=Nitrosophilus kaiyonis TaxID=2930200 RepID=UPI002492E16A|nr:LptF/LptG family permease [Nitrosophilus kaiyonis]
MLNRYLSFLYIKYFFIILSALIIFFVGLDFLQNAKSLPNSANLQILYILYKSFYAIDILLPITIVFAMISTKISLIRSNELVAIYSIGYDKKSVIKPLFVLSFLITLFYILLHTTSFSYANENADNIKKHKFLTSATQNLFFKYNNYYIYFKKLYPFRKEAKDIKIFLMKDHKLEEIIRAKSAFFKNNSWKIENATIVKKIDNKNPKLKILKSKNIDILQGFKPKILDRVYEGKTSFSIIDAILAIKLLKEQNINIQKIKAVLYSQIIYPFFAPFLMVILFYFVPITQRIASITIFSFGAIIFSLSIWGVLYALVRLSFTGVLIPEITTLLPISTLFIISLLFYKKY